MKELQGLTALIIEPHPGMRSSLHNMLNLCGLAKIDDAAGSGQAIRMLGNKSYDLILCEYALEGGQDGQQMLEDLRHHKLIHASTMFFMVTGEGSFGKVVSAVELLPTDYILKPFTADRMLERIGRALDKRNAFVPVYQLIDVGNERAAIAACSEGVSLYPRYATDFLRLRAELHLLLGEAAEAEPIYAALYESKAIGWARLGQAKTLFQRGEYAAAQAMLEDLLENNKRFLDAYDWLARTHQAQGRPQEAQQTLGEAVALSPHAVRRLRRLAEAAVAADDMEVAEKAQKLVVSKAKYSEFRDPEDHVRLVQTLVRKGDPLQAGAAIRELDRSMGGQKNVELCSALCSAMLHGHTGNQARLEESLDAALQANRHDGGGSNAVKTELARLCLAHGREEGAAEVMREVMRNAPDSAAMTQAMAVFEQSGREELAKALARQSRQEVAEMVAAGAAKAGEGDFRGAVELMRVAVTRLPDNPQVVFNAAVAVLKCLEHEGWDERLGQQALSFIAGVRRLDPRNPKLPVLSGLHQQILRKYKPRGLAWMHPPDAL
ncbi:MULTISPECIES: tetratricopeptide repeat-containing response regulator [unclassified Janthinobacterium]|uniref:tetratricopeptide repeat-containing response regulator n=1 Tax=unclassified Janthinobacterium TaxID=2610881 RepID=UPI0016146D87|nr:MULTISPECIES: tetratricopeptide repeat-containing response regulator [unclassified Janthinobacterium]MBB5370359.1 tetratricopeptide (TPR) repeat protein [Janthinobacterium sp. K2C7]MBB5383165.1 tetratricopeptide (TPR) repeat protein [Janthinobacterium sp. K2Li3]MBB5388356.1 tetratricopeptide (TPR) repeat protein [Janthinobacterium sp. K2E3]